MNNKVYLLIGGCIDDKHVLGVFSSIKRAENAMNYLISTDRYYKEYPEDLDIESYKFNALPDYY